MLRHKIQKRLGSRRQMLPTGQGREQGKTSRNPLRQHMLQLSTGQVGGSQIRAECGDPCAIERHAQQAARVIDRGGGLHRHHDFGW